MKGFVFDLDNTLYDRYGTIREFMMRGKDRIMPYINPAYDIEKAIDHVLHTEPLYISGGWEDVYAHLADEHFFNADNTPTFEKVRDFAKKGFTDIAVPFDGVPEFLAELKSRGYTVALLTNSSDVPYQYAKLSNLGLTDSFDKIVVSGAFAELMCGDITNREYEKPDPRIFLYTAKELGIDPSELYYVGDSPVCDMMGALNGGYTPIWVRSRSPWIIENKYMPRLCVDNVKDILDLI